MIGLRQHLIVEKEHHRAGEHPRHQKWCQDPPGGDSPFFRAASNDEKSAHGECEKTVRVRGGGGMTVEAIDSTFGLRAHRAERGRIGAGNAGLQLEARSEINANPADTRDHPEGVWTLPPTLRLGEQDRERYLAIGESDRMTLKFRKP